MQFARVGCDVRLGGVVELDLLEAMVEDRENKRYLPGVEFPARLRACPDLEACLDGVRDVLVVVPSHGLRDTLTRIKPLLAEDARVCWATKGFELSTGKLPHQVAAEVLGPDMPVAVLSGPTFAKEVGAGLPTAMTIASNDHAFARDLAEAISSDNFRAYTSDDIIGVEVGALINRGLVELMRLGVALGAKKETFMGLAGMGDLVLTCTDNLSRNRRMGLALAAGKTVEETQEEIGQVVEGVKAAKAVHEVAEKLGIEMPIVNQVYRILYEGLSPREAVATLMRRELKPESEHG